MHATQQEVRDFYFYFGVQLLDIYYTGSSFMQTTLSNGYPKLLRLFHEFFAQIALHTDTVYTASQQR